MLHKSNSADPISTKPCGGRHPSCLMQAGPSLATKPPTPNLSTNESALDTLAEVTWLCLLLQLSRATTALLKDLRFSVRCELGLVVTEELTKKEWRIFDSDFCLSNGQGKDLFIVDWLHLRISSLEVRSSEQQNQICIRVPNICIQVWVCQDCEI